MKKLIIALALAILVAASVSAVGIGAVFGYDYWGLPGSNVVVTAKLDQYPFIFGLGLAVSSSGLNLGFTADDWIVNEKLFNINDIVIKWYVGLGGYLGVSSSGFYAGARVPIGLNSFVTKQVEVFLEIAPTLALKIPLEFPVYGLMSGLGFRFWL
jgi:hypothetical protein